MKPKRRRQRVVKAWVWLDKEDLLITETLSFVKSDATDPNLYHKEEGDHLVRVEICIPKTKPDRKEKP